MTQTQNRHIRQTNNSRKVPALHGFVSQVVFCTAQHCTWQANNPHCTELHRPAGKATMHGFAGKTCKWIPNFTDLHGTAWKVPVKSLCPIKTLPNLGPWLSWHDAAHGKHRAPIARICTDPPLHGFARTCPNSTMHGFARKTCNRILKCTELHGFHAAALSFLRGCTSPHGNFLA